MSNFIKSYQANVGLNHDSHLLLGLLMRVGLLSLLTFLMLPAGFR
jgi:hypothetical protein